MTCTPSYCDDHDYPVRGPWCAMAHAQQGASRMADLRDEIRTEVRAALYEELDREPEQVRKPRPAQLQPSAPKAKAQPEPGQGGYTWNRL